MVYCVYIQISRVSIDSCDLYADCESCVSSQDVLGCVWCSRHCVVRSECRLSHFDTHQPYDTHCPPVITDVSSLSVLLISTMLRHSTFFCIQTIRRNEICRENSAEPEIPRLKTKQTKVKADSWEYAGGLLAQGCNKPFIHHLGSLGSAHKFPHGV